MTKYAIRRLHTTDFSRDAEYAVSLDGAFPYWTTSPDEATDFGRQNSFRVARLLNLECRGEFDYLVFPLDDNTERMP